MVIEDDPNVCEGIRRRMEKYDGWNCIGLCTSFTESVEAIQKHHPELLFLDWAIKGGNSFQILQRIKSESGYHPYVVFFTGYRSDRREIHEEMVNTHKVHRYFGKPIWEKLDTCLSQCLTEAKEHADRNTVNIPLWIETVEKERVKVFPGDLVCIHQSENPRHKILCFSGSLMYEVKANWQYCEKLLKKFGINYFVVNKRESIINLDCIEKIESNLLRLKQNIQVKISKEKLKELEILL